MSNHIGNANKMVGDTPRTDAEYERLFEIYKNAERINGPLCCAFENDMRLCSQLERELNAANAEVERLTAKVAQLYDGAEKQKQLIKRLEGELESTKADRDSWSNQSDEFAKTAADLIIHIKLLEEAGNDMVAEEDVFIRLKIWMKAKEAKP